MALANPTLEDFKTGDRVTYFLRADHWLKATVKRVTDKRVVIKVDGDKWHRNTLPRFLRKEEA